MCKKFRRSVVDRGRNFDAFAEKVVSELERCGICRKASQNGALRTRLRLRVPEIRHASGVGSGSGE